MIADGTGLAKRSVQTALTVLKRRRLVVTKQKTPTSAPAYTLHCDWR